MTLRATSDSRSVASSSSASVAEARPGTGPVDLGQPHEDRPRQGPQVGHPQRALDQRDVLAHGRVEGRVLLARSATWRRLMVRSTRVTRTAITTKST